MSAKVTRAPPPTHQPQGARQRRYVDALEAPGRPAIVVAHGPAGCGKTKFAVDVGMHKLMTGEVDRVVITRPAVSVGAEQHGFLPGSLNDKMRPWLLPVMDAVSENIGRSSQVNKSTKSTAVDAVVERMLRTGELEFAPLAFMRGRTLSRAWVVCDEAQNATPAQLLMVMTRLGRGSKLVITGDTSQGDLSSCSASRDGLTDLVERLSQQPPDALADGQFALLEFEADDVQRSDAVRAALRLYGPGTL